MANNFKKIAQESTQLCSLMVGRSKLETADIIGRDLTIMAFDFAPKFDKQGEPIIDPQTGEADVFGVVVFSEEPTAYYGVGTVFTKVCKAWMSGFTSAEEASAALLAEGGVRVKFTESKTRRGNNLTAVEILD